MDDKEQRQRERAYQVWEDEGRPDGFHEDHWQRAEDKDEASGEEASEITEANQKAAETFEGDRGGTSARNGSPPTIISPD